MRASDPDPAAHQAQPADLRPGPAVARVSTRRPAAAAAVEPIRMQRRASNTGVIMVAGQEVALGRAHRHQNLTVFVSETTLTIDLDDGETRVVRRTTTATTSDGLANAASSASGLSARNAA